MHNLNSPPPPTPSLVSMIIAPSSVPPPPPSHFVAILILDASSLGYIQAVKVNSVVKSISPSNIISSSPSNSYAPPTIPEETQVG